MKKSIWRGFGVYLILVLLLVGWFMTIAGSRSSADVYTRQDLMRDLEADNVSEAVISPNAEVPTGILTVSLFIGGQKKLYVSDVADIGAVLEKYDVRYVVEDVKRQSIFMTTILPMLVMGVLVVIVYMLLMRQSGGGGNKMMNFGRSRARMLDAGASKIRFEHVAGLEEEKEELAEIVDFLRSPQKYVALGARIPKGVILTGPPGTGKTLLAKAVSGEAGVPFFSISGSDFVEMFVGVGASRVRDLFEDAKHNAPCIVFIDEIDAVARQRGTGMGGGHDEREQTLNQLLVEMDGFGVNEGIIVIAATNRADILDPAILRPGRFDRKVYVGRPDVKGRREILDVHVKNKPLADDVDLENLARTTAGFTGADLENLVNEAAIFAAKAERRFIKQEDINQAFIKTGIGTEKKSRLVSEKEKRITAYHEAGHAILFHLLPDVGPVHTISVIPTGVGAAGYTMPLPEKDEMLNTKSRMLQDIMVCLGGRIAEELIFNDITTGASQDIKQCTDAARKMVIKYGFSDKIGPINYESDSDEVFLGRDLGHARSYGEEVAGTIDSEIKTIIDDCYGKARELIEQNIKILHECANYLIEHEKMGRAEFEALFAENSVELTK